MRGRPVESMEASLVEIFNFLSPFSGLASSGSLSFPRLGAFPSSSGCSSTSTRLSPESKSTYCTLVSLPATGPRLLLFLARFLTWVSKTVSLCIFKLLQTFPLWELLFSSGSAASRDSRLCLRGCTCTVHVGSSLTSAFQRGKVSNKPLASGALDRPMCSYAPKFAKRSLCFSKHWYKSPTSTHGFGLWLAPPLGMLVFPNSLFQDFEAFSKTL